MRAIIASSLGLALAIAGCTASLGTSGYGPRSASDLDTLNQVASSQMRCPAHQIQTRAISDRVWVADGCGQSREFAWSGQRGYGGRWQTITPVGAFASNELSCPTQSLVVHAPQENVRRVSGCGQRATYELSCDTQTCAWIMTERELLGRPGVTVTPPVGSRPGPYATRPAPSYPPPYTPTPQGYGPSDPRVDSAIRSTLESQRHAILRCSGGQPVQLRARWGADGRVWLSVASTYQGMAIEQCIQQSVGTFQVTSGAGGELVHVVQ